MNAQAETIHQSSLRTFEGVRHAQHTVVLYVQLC